MAAKYCTDEKLRIWNLGHEVSCDPNPDRCKYLVKFGKQEYCGWCPPRCTLHQVIRGQAHCLWCKYATKKLDCAKCLPCLSADNRIHFERTE